MAEFDGIRAALYKQALADYPEARKTDLQLMFQYFSPQVHEVVLEVGAGNGLFSGAIADHVEKIYVADPSAEQLAGVVELNRKNLIILNNAAEDIALPQKSIDGIWSFGAVHHIRHKTVALKNFFRVLKPASRLIIGDVFVGSQLARHFDDRVAKYCVTGHEVTFLSQEFARSLCALTGFEQPEFHNFNARWKFNRREDVGDFLYKLHAMTKATPADCLAGAEEILGIEENDNSFFLNWPMTMMTTRRL